MLLELASALTGVLCGEKGSCKNVGGDQCIIQLCDDLIKNMLA